MADELLIKRFNSRIAIKWVGDKAVQVLYRGFSTSYFFYVEGFEDLVNVGGLSELD